jgi:hypothetical protein
VVRHTARGTLIRKEKSEFDKQSGWYLSYDPTGKRKGVFLTKQAGRGSYWGLSKTVRKETEPYDYTITASNGELAGWHLGAGAEAETLTDQDGDEFRAREAVLVRDPKAKPRYYLFEIAP